MRRQNDALEIFRAKQSMSAKVAVKDSDYSSYSGADLETALKLAKIDAVKKSGLLPEKLFPLLDLSRIFLDQKRKAIFASIGTTEISKLGFILGKETGEAANADLPF